MQKKSEPSSVPGQPAETTNRHSDAELEELRVLITAKIEAARKELQFLQAQLTGKDEEGNEIDRHLSVEDGSATRELEQAGQLIARQIQFVKNLENALLRIHHKTYGICRQTGKLIDKARLRAVPHATLSMEAKLKKH